MKRNLYTLSVFITGVQDGTFVTRGTLAVTDDHI